MKRIAPRASATGLGLIGLLIVTLAAPRADAQTDSNQSKVHPLSPSVVSYTAGRSAPVFIENRGQFDSRVRFQAKVAGKTLWLTDKGIVFDLRKPRSAPHTDGAPSAVPGPASRVVRPPMDEPIERLVFAENFVGSNEHPAIEAKGTRAGVYNYLVGNDPASSHTDVHGYGELLYRDVWPGIDVRISANGSDLEQEFVVRPGGDPRKIKVGYHGIEKLKVASDGSLAVQTAFGVLRESKPRIYQQLPGKTATVKGRFALSGASAYTFAVDSYRPEYALVIDPTVLLYSTYLGGSGDDQGWAIAADSAGNAYAAGYTSSPNFPTTAGAYLTTFTPGFESFITKLGPTGIPIYSTFYYCNGCNSTFIRGIAVDSAGEAIITGTDGDSVIVAKLNAAGNALLYEVILGDGTSNAIAVDSSGNAYVAGGSSGGLKTTANAYQQSPAGNPLGLCCIYGADAFVAVVNPQGSLIYSTYFGGFYSDGATAIAVDAYGAVYLGGITYGPTLPTTPGAFQTTFPVSTICYQCNSGWVAKLNPNVAGTAGLIYASYLGGSANTWLYAIAVDSSGSAYAAGVTASADFPMTAGAFNPTNSCGGGFVTKFNPGGSGPVYSTCFGSGVSLQAIALDTLGEAYVVGYAGVVPVTPGAFQPVAKSQNAFLVKLNAAGSGVIYGSYLGGSIADVAHAVAVDPTGDAYLTGATDSLDFPVTPFAFQPNSGGGAGDAFVTKFPLGPPGAISVTGIIPTAGGNAGTVSPEITGTGFHAGATAQLNCGGVVVPGTNLTVGASGQLLNMTFNLTTASPGTCDVQVTNPGGTSATLSQSFTVQQGGAPNVQIYLTGVVRVPENQLATPAAAAYFVTATNAGNVDAPARLIFGALGSGLSLTSVQPPGVADAAALAADGVVGWSVPGLSPGQSAALSYYGTISTTLAAGSELPIGPVWGFPDRPPPFPLPLPLPPLPVPLPVPPPPAPPPVSPAEFLGCTQQEWGNCASAAPACAVAVYLCTSPGYTNAGACDAAIAACVGAALNCPFTKACFPPGLALFAFLVFELDPNAIVGPAGVGGQHWMSGRQALTYGISFGNDPSATAPAQQVVVTQPLGADVNPASVSLVGLNIPNGTGNVQIPIPAGSFNPAGGVDEFTTTVDLRPAQNLLVNVDAKLNNQGLTWTLGSIDPATGQPPLNPLVGFLPPGTGGNVAFGVTPRPGLATGTQVSDQAAVVFDANAPVSTPTWTNTIDNTPPLSAVSALAAKQSTSCFRPQWTATDIGSGVQGTTIFVSDSGGAYAPWLTNTTAASAIYNGVGGHTYSFYSQSTDLVGNVEATHATPDASTAVTAGASCNGRPTIAGSVSSNSLSGTTESLTLHFTNNGVGNAQNIKITSVSLRTLVGTGSVTLSSPSTPISVGSLAAGASVTETFTLNAPATVKEYSITEAGTVQDLAGNTYSFSMAEAVIP